MSKRSVLWMLAWNLLLASRITVGVDANWSGGTLVIGCIAAIALVVCEMVGIGE